jgi:uncharacterized protein VirK/YbjX
MLDDFCANIITNKIVLWEQIIMLNLFTIHLELPNHDLEGDVNLVFRMNGIGIYYLSFTIVPGKILDIASEHVIFIARVQGVHKYYGLIMQCTKDFNYIAPSEVLVTAIQAIATALNIDSIAGITANEQLSKGCGDFIFDYDRLWIKVGGYKINKQAFHIPTQPYERPLDMIKTNHRSRKRHKRQLKRDIYNHIIQAFEQKCCKKPIGIGISS